MRFLARSTLTITILLLAGSYHMICAQEIIPPIVKLQSSDCLQSLYDRAEKLYSRIAIDSNTMFAERLISKIVAICPSADLDLNLQSELETLHELHADHSFLIAKYYFDQFKKGRPGFKGAQSRFIGITTKYPRFSKIDEVLLLLGETFVYDDNYENAEAELKKLKNDFPASTARGSIEADLEIVQTNRLVFQVSQGPQILEISDGSSKP